MKAKSLLLLFYTFIFIDSSFQVLVRIRDIGDKQDKENNGSIVLYVVQVILLLQAIPTKTESKETE